MSASELTVERLLRAHAPHAPETLRERVLALESAPQRRHTPSRRLVLVALPAALAIAVLAAVVHGVVGSGSPRAVPATKSFSAQTQGPAVGRQWRRDCPFVRSTAAPTPCRLCRLQASAHRRRLQHTDASLQVRVNDVDALAAATSRATRIATSLGGYAQSVDYRTPNGGGGASYLELRVPAQNVKTAIARLGGLGTLVSQELSVTDLQQTFRTQSEQIAQLRRRVAALHAALTGVSLPEAQKVLLQIRLAESKRALAQRLNARKGTISAGTTAQISLVIGTEKAIAPVAHHRGTPRPDDALRRRLPGARGNHPALRPHRDQPARPRAAAIWAWRRRSVERLLAA